MKALWEQIIRAHDELESHASRMREQRARIYVSQDKEHAGEFASDSHRQEVDSLSRQIQDREARAAAIRLLVRDRLGSLLYAVITLKFCKRSTESPT